MLPDGCVSSRKTILTSENTIAWQSNNRRSFIYLWDMQSNYSLDLLDETWNCYIPLWIDIFMKPAEMLSLYTHTCTPVNTYMPASPRYRVNICVMFVNIPCACPYEKLCINKFVRLWFNMCHSFCPYLFNISPFFGAPEGLYLVIVAFPGYLHSFVCSAYPRTVHGVSSVSERLNAI